MQVRNAFVYACPDGIFSSRHTSGRCVFGMPRRSMRCPPVIFTIFASYFSATSASRRSSSGEVTPPNMRGTTLKVPSRCIFACTRSLMKRASRSSSYSSAHIVFSSDANPILLAASSLPPASVSSTADTLRSPCSLIAAVSSALVIGIAGT